MKASSVNLNERGTAYSDWSKARIYLFDPMFATRETERQAWSLFFHRPSLAWFSMAGSWQPLLDVFDGHNIGIPKRLQISNKEAEERFEKQRLEGYYPYADYWIHLETGTLSLVERIDHYRVSQRLAETVKAQRAQSIIDRLRNDIGGRKA